MPNYLSLHTISLGYLIMHFKAGSIDFMYVRAGITGGRAERAKLNKPELMR
jgi:hypothetical protein